MKIAIIYPNLEATPQSLDMGVAYLATYLDERTNHQVKIIDLTFHKKNWQQYLITSIKKFDPDVVGISIVSLFYDYSKTIAQIVKSEKNVPIIAGGYQPTMSPEETIKDKEFDVICIGDGEYTVTEYLDALENKQDLKQVKGIWFKENGKIIKNEFREYISNLDDLPIPNYDLFDDIDMYLYYLQRLYVIGTRGCPYNCSFCAESILDKINPGTRYRERDPVKYVKEIEFLYNRYKDRGMTAAHIYDTVFTFNTKWFNAWADEYMKCGLHKILPYSTFMKADQQNASDDKLDLLAKSGCHQVRIGIESGDDEIREKIILKKGSGDNKALDIIKKCNARGIIVKTYSILGIPGDTKESIQKTYKYSQSPLIHVALVFSYTPLPGTPLAQMAMGMNEFKSTGKKFSFHFSKGAKLPGVSKYFVPCLLLKSYLFFGMRLAFNTLMSCPFLFLYTMITRVLTGFKIGCPIMISSGYALICPIYWPKLSKRVKKRWETKYKYKFH